ncbi:ABC transporter permease [Rhodohalobacter mucosus]|uniref:ABC transporter permease n=1 Tax=Rhodohalobacter mucosus TaxID=2079485 RepID=A0A316TL86_9BACT|nr:ABC transporter permease [Rhodohalobacter mucosus]PWN05327.1 ABC transporter permease [Rhodohalobacter mucosus]
MKKLTVLLFLLLSFLVPVATLLYLSFSVQWYYPSIIDHPFTTEHWTWYLSGGSELLRSTVLSVLLSITVSALSVICGFFASRAIAYYTRSRWWVVSAYFPYVIAPVVLAVMLNYYFLQLQLSGTVGGVIIAQFLITFPYAIIFFYGFWNTEMRNLEGLVSTMGGSFFTIVKHALFPSARGLLTICFFQCYLISWFEYGLTQFIGVGKVQTLTVMVYRYVSEANPYLAALAGVLLVIPPVLLLITNRKYLLQNVWAPQS